MVSRANSAKHRMYSDLAFGYQGAKVEGQVEQVDSTHLDLMKSHLSSFLLELEKLAVLRLQRVAHRTVASLL